MTIEKVVKKSVLKSRAMIWLTGNRSPMKLAWLLWKRSDANTIFGAMVLNNDFKEFIRSLNNNQVRYLIIGGYAVAFHGHPRYTKDLDIWLDSNPENAQQILAALEQ
jgi:hypothetical protein